jgi:hypothetical protein
MANCADVDMIFITYKFFFSHLFISVFIHGAGEGNRTLIASLEGWCFTTKLHPLSFSKYYEFLCSTAPNKS